MSNEATTWAQSRKVGNSPAKFVLLVLADYAGHDWSCYPSVKNLSKITELGESTIRKALALLTEQGLIKIFGRYRPDGSQRSSRYQLLVLGEETPQPDADDWAYIRATPKGWVSEREGGGASGAEGGVSEREAIPLVDPSVDPSPIIHRASHVEQVVEDGLFPAPAGTDLEVSETVNAGMLTRQWIDYCRVQDVKLTAIAIKRYGAGVKRALTDGFEPDLIKRALGAMLTDRVVARPALLDNYLIRVQQGPELPPARLSPHQADAERRAAAEGTTAAARLYDALTRPA